MDRAALPLWIEIVRAVGPTVSSMLVFASALTAAIVAWRTYRQRKEADERAEWWRRTQWAVDYASDPEEEKASIGVDALDRLSVSPLATEEDRSLIDTLFTGVVAAREKRAYTGTTTSDAQTGRLRRRLRRVRRGE